MKTPPRDREPQYPAPDLDRYSVGRLRERTGRKWADRGSADLAAWIADMDFEVAYPIKDALRRLIASDDLGYPSDGAFKAISSQFTRRMRTRFGLSIAPEHVVVTADVIQAIGMAVVTLTRPKDPIIVQTPIYPPFLRVLAETNRRLVPNPLLETPSGFTVDLDELEKSVRASGAVMLMLCNPHNPTGRVLTRAELTRIAEIAVDHDMIVVSDEVHADLVYGDRRHVPIASLGPSVASRTVTLFSASKAFNIGGICCGVAAFTNPALQQRFEAFPASVRGVLGALGLVAAVAAWESCDAWLSTVLSYLERNRDFLRHEIGVGLPGISFHAPDATYFAWLDCQDAELGEEPATWFLERAGVMLYPGTEFGAPGVGHARLNFATSRSVLEDIIERMAAAMHLT